METVSATELARNTREILDKVASHGQTIAIERNRTEIARLVPAERSMTVTQALAGLKPMLARKQAAAWLRESRRAFDEAVRDPWE